MGMQRKKVYIDDYLIGEAATWREVHALTKAQGLFFIKAPRVAEGPSWFYLAAAPVERSAIGIRKSAGDYSSDCDWRLDRAKGAVERRA
jgi:hypothetical protein